LAYGFPLLGTKPDFLTCLNVFAHGDTGGTTWLNILNLDGFYKQPTIKQQNVRNMLNNVTQ
jgi:hypothetical protein